MIIGENIEQYYGYEENYDYLFKNKKRGGAPSPRQQKKAERKANKPAPRPGSFRAKRQDKKAGIVPKKKLIMGNFGLFNKNKRKEEAAKIAAATQDASTLPDAELLPNAPALDEAAQEPEMNSSPEATMPSASEENPEPGAPSGAEGEDSSESGYDDPPSTPKPDTKKPGKGAESKSSGPGVWLGWGFLAITVGVIFYTVVKLDKLDSKLPDNNNLH